MTTITTTTNITTPVDVRYQTRLLERANQLTPYFLGSDARTLEFRAGTFTIKVRRYEQLTPSTTPLSPLSGNLSLPTGRTSDVPTVTDYTVAVQKYGQYIILNEEVDLMNPNDTTAEMVDLLGEAAGRSLNFLQRNVREDNFTKVFANGTADNQVNTVISAARIADVVVTLHTLSARPFTPMTSGDRRQFMRPIKMSYWAFCHPHVGYDLAQLSQWTPVERYATQTPIQDGEIGSFGGSSYDVRFIATEDASVAADAGATGGTNVRSTGGTNADLYSVVIIGRYADTSVGFGAQHVEEVYRAVDGARLPAVMMISQGLGSAGSGDPYREIETEAYKTWHAGLITNPNWGRVIRCAATNTAAV